MESDGGHGSLSEKALKYNHFYRTYGETYVQVEI